LAAHMKVHRTQFNCNYCGEDFSGKSSLRAHCNSSHEDKKEYACTHEDSEGKCTHTFFKKAELRRHTAKHGDKSLTCSICAKSLPHETVLRAHEISHTQEDPIPKYSCTSCGKRYISPQALSTHTRYIHEQRGAFACRVGNCGKSFGTETYRSAHEVRTYNLYLYSYLLGIGIGRLSRRQVFLRSIF
jgi:KRAB domain-containing zinc finger protein